MTASAPHGLVDVTFVWNDAEATAVLLWANGLFDDRDVVRNEFTRLPGSDLWTLSLRMPPAWRASYVITPHQGKGDPPWRVATERRAIRLAAMAGRPDPRNPLRSRTMSGAEVSIVELGDAPPNPHHHAPRGREPRRFDAVDAPGRVWLYEPRVAVTDAPLVILFDGQVWAQQLSLADTLDAAIAAGELPPLYVALVDSVDPDVRWEQLGTPAGTVAWVRDSLIAQLRRQLPVTTDAARTVVSGASFGGLASLWLVALAPELVGAAVAQSSSLWRYDLREPLLAAGPGVRLVLQAGCYEPGILDVNRTLHAALTAAGHDVSLTEVVGGHDWAWWQPGLIEGLRQLL